MDATFIKYDSDIQTKNILYLVMSSLREAAKKRSFFSGPETKALTPPPRAYWPQKNFHNFFFRASKNPPSLLVAGPLKKTVFCGFPNLLCQDARR